MTATWMTIGSLLLGAIVGVANVVALWYMTARLGQQEHRHTAAKIAAGYLLRICLTGAALWLALRAGPLFAVVTCVGMLVGRSVSMARLSHK